MSLFESFMKGFGLTGLSVVFAYLVTRWHFGKSYHFSVLLWAFSACYALAAWIIHTRIKPAKSGRSAFLTNLVPALLWAAGQLALLTWALYHFWGVGAHYYR